MYKTPSDDHRCSDDPMMGFHYRVIIGLMMMHVHIQSMKMDEISALLHSHSKWETGPWDRAVAAVHYEPQSSNPRRSRHVPCLYIERVM